MGLCRKLMYLVPVVVAYYYFSADKFDPESIRGKKVLVTGASSGIGEEVAYRYAELGAKLVITARRKELLDKVALRCKELGAQAVDVVAADMSLPADWGKVADFTLKHLNGLDILVLNHAMMGYAWWKGTAQNVTYLDKMMDINFMSFVDLTSKFQKTLEQSKGYIVVVSSMSGKVGVHGMTHYCASKHALQGFFSSLRQELRFRNTGVSVTLVVYGPVYSERAAELVKDMPTSVDFKTLAGTTKDAADALVRGVSARLYEIYFPIFSTIFSTLYRMFPKFFEDLSTNSIPEDQALHFRN